MTGASLWLAAALTAAPIRGQAAAETSEPIASPKAPDAGPLRGWVKEGRSLLLYDKEHALVSEIGLESTQDASSGRVVVHEIIGGAARSGRFAWTMERTTTWDAPQTKVLDSQRLLRVLGTEGQELWTSETADAPQGEPPVAMSDDGEVMMVSLRERKGWRVAAKGYLGDTLIDVASLAKLEHMAITRNGRYALVRWLVPDESATHTFLNLKTKSRKDIPSAQLELGVGAIGEDGRVRSGGKLVADLEARP